MDGCRRKMSHPDYDPRTLYVPQDFLSKQSPGMRQWWEIKSRYADAILFFKVGKFYELYHMDAAVGVEHLGLVYMRGSFAHCGFPELAFPRMAEGLVKKGFKVARVEQTESVEAMTERTRGKPSSEKVVRREVCQMLTPGTCTASTRSEISGSSGAVDSENSNADSLPDSDAAGGFLLVFTERGGPSDSERTFGVALLDASNGKIMIGQFIDDRHCSRLRTMVAHYPPSQVLTERGNVGLAAKPLFDTCLSGIPVENLVREKQFWTARETIMEIETMDYFSEKGGSTVPKAENCFSGKHHWPPTLLKMLSEDDPLGHTVKSEYDLAVSCLGAVIFYLRYCLIDKEVLSLGFIEEYVPPDLRTFSSFGKLSDRKEFYHTQSSMVLDSITLANLDLLRNSTTGTREGTLIERLDTCCTPFGRRLLQRWVTAPPCNPNVIRRRQEAVENLINLKDELPQVREGLKQLPDFERLLAKIHLLGSRGLDKNHPDNRAILFDEIQYSRKNIVDFVVTLDGYEKACRIIEKLCSVGLRSGHLKALVTLKEEGGQFPSLRSKITYFKNAFDAEKAKRDGRIIPEPGIDEEYDAALKEIKLISKELDDFLASNGARMGVRLAYWGTNRNRFQIEVPDSAVSRVPHAWQLASQRKGVKRYRSPETQELFAQLVSAEERKDAALRVIMQHIFASFTDSFQNWHSAMKCLAELDCLIALAQYSMNAATVTCLPIFVDLSESIQQPFLDIVEGQHPCLLNTFTGGDVIPNDVHLGSGESADDEIQSKMPLTLLVTGPNMGGKSTLMRQTALLTVLAHLGCRIPASSCRLTPVDRIFSRLGASDRLLAGESTFLVELSETSAILRHATCNSLVLMDELGRGTSTHDGVALAGAVLNYLANHYGNKSGSLGPRTLFSTHYHSLVDDVVNKSTSHIGLGHMACMVEEQSDAEPGLENITFLYKFIPGACPKSYGFNAARLAHLPDQVIQRGLTKAKEFERTSATFACLRNLLSGTVSLEDAKSWMTKLKSF
ncbi:unnamed protein product [Calicophoron daubneyi]